MRRSFWLLASFALVVSAFACSSSSDSPAGPSSDSKDASEGSDGSTPLEGGPDATDGVPKIDGGSDAGGLAPFIATPEVSVEAAIDTATCYYFRTPNTAPVGVQRWRLKLTGMVQSAHVFTTASDLKTPGTVSADDCGFVSGSTLGNWVAPADTASSELTMPADDGAGKPVAYEIPANSAGYVFMHVTNSTATAATAKAVIEADVLALGTDYTKTATFVSYKGNLDIQADLANQTASQSCAVSSSLNFWRLTTYTHKRATNAEIDDGTTPLVTTTDWQHPAVQTYGAPFHSFAGAFKTICTYDNTANGQPLSAGNSVVTAEQCIGVGLFFPATTSLRCFNGTML